MHKRAHRLQKKIQILEWRSQSPYLNLFSISETYLESSKNGCAQEMPSEIWNIFAAESGQLLPTLMGGFHIFGKVVCYFLVGMKVHSGNMGNILKPKTD